MYLIIRSKKFEKDYALCYKRGLNIELIDNIVRQLFFNGIVEAKHRPHKLSGNYNNCWECHIKPDWLLIWKIENENIYLVRTGIHADIF